MAKSIISYEKELPEIPDRLPWEEPESFLVRDSDSPDGYKINETGRRPSSILLVPKIREQVNAWRRSGYLGASGVTLKLFPYWFDEEHSVKDFSTPFRYYFCQREAIETLAWLVEVAGIKDTKKLIEALGTVFQSGLFTKNIQFETDGDRRQIIRYIPELDGEGVQELPPKNLRRYAFKMATGSGKTWVMAMAIVWSYFHKMKVKESPLSTNFLLVAPNVIVFQRLQKDFANNSIFRLLPFVPPEWRPFEPKVILRGESMEPDASGNIFLTNIQQLYESRDKEWTPENAVDAMLGKKPVKDLSSAQRSMLERVKSLKDIVVINDEAHHVHEPDLQWSRSLVSIHEAMPKGLSLWLDFSATPKDQKGMYYSWTVCDYPLAQAVEDRIVKAPIINTRENDPARPKKEPDDITKENIDKKCRYWIDAAVKRWKDHQEVYKKLSVRPVLFIMAEKNNHADAIGHFIKKAPEYRFKEEEVLVIHTDSKGEITKGDLEEARKIARDIDLKENKVKVIVSVMMLREGWDVKNVTIVLGLRPFSAKAEILPEQVIGRGLRLMSHQEIGPDRTQTLEVLGTPKLLEVLQRQLEIDDVGYSTTKTDPNPPVSIYPMDSRKAYDITIPLTKPDLTHEVRNLSNLDIKQLGPIFDQSELAEIYRIKMKQEFATTQSKVGQIDLSAEEVTEQEFFSSLTKRVMDLAKLTNCFSELYPLIRKYVLEKCFGRVISFEEDAVRSNLARFEIQDSIARYLAKKLGELTAKRKTIEFEKRNYRLSETKAFIWRRNLPLHEGKKTVFNYVATYNDFEKRFAKFLDSAGDVLRFASLGTTEQGDSGTHFRVSYLKPSGAIGFYHPDWVAIQKTKEGEVNWIIETKGRVWEGTEAKDAAMHEWCKKVTTKTGKQWKFARVNQREFEKSRGITLTQLFETLWER